MRHATAKRPGIIRGTGGGVRQAAGGAAALAPIVVPILLMALGSIAAMAGWTGFAYDLCAFLGAPIIALAVGTLFGVVLLAGAKRLNKFYELTNETLKTVGPPSCSSRQRAECWEK